ncbi:MAG: hypothetical protein HY951_15275, partial [Bacteroidia bacterium]|nr:hypothetical protein [Bacteroidia bacterium]
MRKNLRWCFYLFIIIVTINSCKNKNVSDIISGDCKSEFDIKVYSEFLRNIFENPSDSSSICYKELNNFDTLKFFYSTRDYRSVWFTEDFDFNTVDSILKFFQNSYTHGLKPSWYFGDYISSKIYQLKSVKINCDSVYQIL